MASKGGCVNGTLVTESYTSPIPLVGLYIAVATSVCFICMTYDLVYGLFKRKTRPYLPCRWFPMNAFTLTVLAVATKIPNDLITTMPRREDQLSKLTGTALMCTAIGFYMPSMGTMKTSERYGNLAAFNVLVITMVVNVCIQIHTGVIFAFTTEHIIIMVCMVVLLLLMWSSAVAFREQIDQKRFFARKQLHDSKDKLANFQGLGDLVGLAEMCNYVFNPQTMLCRSPNHHTFGLLCVVSSAVVLQSMVRYWFAPESIDTCITTDTVSDYKWSIPVVIWSQLLTIVVGSSFIIYRWYSILRRFEKRFLQVGCPQMELEILRLKTLPPLIRFLNKKLSNVLVVAKDFFIDYGLIPIQITLYKCNIFFVGKPLHCVMRFLHKQSEHIEVNVYSDEMKRDLDSYARDCPTNLLALIVKNCSAGTISSECAALMGDLEATGKKYEMSNEIEEYGYRISCVSVLVLSGILAELMPPSSSRGESIVQSLKESFEIIYFVDQRTHPPIWDNERRWTSAQDVWANWENPTHWFRTEIFSKFNLKEVHDLGALRIMLDDIEVYFLLNIDWLKTMCPPIYSLTESHIAFVSIEFAIICKFLREQSESAEDLFDFLEMCFVKMLCFTLSTFPLAVLNELDGDDPYEIGEGRARKALKYLFKLGFLSNNIEWSWQAKSGHSAAGAGGAVAGAGAASDAAAGAVAGAASGAAAGAVAVADADDNDGTVAVGNGTISAIGSNDEEVRITMSVNAS